MCNKVGYMHAALVEVDLWNNLTCSETEPPLKSCAYSLLKAW